MGLVARDGLYLFTYYGRTEVVFTCICLSIGPLDHSKSDERISTKFCGRWSIAPGTISWILVTMWITIRIDVPGPTNFLLKDSYLYSYRIKQENPLNTLSAISSYHHHHQQQQQQQQQQLQCHHCCLQKSHRKPMQTDGKVFSGQVSK